MTVYAKDATTADGLDDAILIVGVQRGLQLIESIPDAGAIIVDSKTSAHLQPPALAGPDHTPSDGI